jgi:hypothetical protein
MKCPARQACSPGTPRLELSLLQKGRTGYLQNAGVLLLMLAVKSALSGRDIANGTTKSDQGNITIPFGLQHLLYNRAKMIHG